MEPSAFELPSPPKLDEVAREQSQPQKGLKEQLEDLFLEISYLLDADFIVDRLIAQAYR